MKAGGNEGKDIPVRKLTDNELSMFNNGMEMDFVRIDTAKVK
jgi:hypothetical protein